MGKRNTADSSAYNDTIVCLGLQTIHEGGKGNINLLKRMSLNSYFTTTLQDWTPDTTIYTPRGKEIN